MNFRFQPGPEFEVILILSAYGLILIVMSAGILQGYDTQPTPLAAFLTDSVNQL